MEHQVWEKTSFQPLNGSYPTNSNYGQWRFARRKAISAVVFVLYAVASVTFSPLWNVSTWTGTAFAPGAASGSVTSLWGTALTPTSGRRCSRYPPRQTSELMIHWSCCRRTLSDSIRCRDPVAFFFFFPQSTSKYKPMCLEGYNKKK